MIGVHENKTQRKSDMSANVKELTDATFLDATASGVTLVDFWAPWCGPCRMQGPIIEQLAAEIGDKALVAKINIDEHTAAATTYGVRSIPTLMLFKDGKLVKQYVGVQNKDVLTAAINEQL